MCAPSAPPSQPSSQTVTQTSIPEYARPYVERMLGKSEALSGTPYQAYGGERIAGFTPLQQQAFEGVSNLGPAQQLGTATQMAGLAGLRGLETRYNPAQFASTYQAPGMYQPGQFGILGAGTNSFIQPGMAQAYMSPYQQAVTDIEKREATRGSDILKQQQQAQAVQQGAFGGARSGIVEAERQRNLAQQLGDIQARGGQAAYQTGMQQFNAEQQARLQAQLANQQAFMEAQRLGETSRQFGYGQGMTAAEAAARYGTEAQRMAEQSRQFGADIGLRGAATGLQAAGALGQLGQTQFGQQKDIIQGQLSAGEQQRALEQQRLQQAYQDFQTQRQYPYQQLAFMSDMLRGLPLSQYSQTMYAQPPSVLGQVAGAGLTYLGAQKAGLFGAEGGVVPGGLASVAANKLMQG